MRLWKCPSLHSTLNYLCTLGDTGFFRLQGIVKATVSEVFEDLKKQILEGSDQNWSCPDYALLAVSASEILKLKSSNTSETVAFNITSYQTFETP